MSPPPPPPLPGAQGSSGLSHGERLKSKSAKTNETLGRLPVACRVRTAGTRRSGNSRTAIRTMAFFMSLPSVILSPTILIRF
jgi:hypothetical protein